MHITQIGDKFCACAQIQYGDMDALAKQGFSTIINHRPDGEEASQPLSKALAKAAKKSGLHYHYIPFRPGRASAEDKQKLQDILANDPGKTLAFCRSGARARSLYKSVNRSPGFFARLFGR